MRQVGPQRGDERGGGGVRKGSATQVWAVVCSEARPSANVGKREALVGVREGIPSESPQNFNNVLETSRRFTRVGSSLAGDESKEMRPQGERGWKNKAKGSVEKLNKKGLAR